MNNLEQRQNKDLSNQDELSRFLDAVEKTPIATTTNDRGRLIFAMDATASREASWDRASQLQGDMFVKTKGLAQLDVQLVYYKGYTECRASNWVHNTQSLLKLMQSVRCEAGMTQIERVLKHAIAEHKLQSVQALVFIGDCIEEDIDQLCKLAGELKILNLPLFIFQEAHEPNASLGFSQLCKISGGAHCRFDQYSADQLGQLLNAVAVYATGGRSALKKLASTQHTSARFLLEQLDA